MTTPKYHPDPHALDAPARLTAEWFATPWGPMYVETWRDGLRAIARAEQIGRAGYHAYASCELRMIGAHRSAWVAVVKAVPQIPPIDAVDEQQATADARLAAARERAQRQLDEDDAA